MKRSLRHVAVLLAAPYVVGLFLLLVLPMCVAVVLAFTEYYGFETPRFSGLENLRRAWSDVVFAASLRNVVIISLVAVPLRLALAVGAALLLQRRGRGARPARALTYLPSVVPDAAWALLWLWLLNPLYGPLSTGMRAVGLPAPAFLTDPGSARIGVSLLLAFQVGEAFVVALAARRAIPSLLYEASSVEGASATYVVRRVTLPLMAPLIGLLAARDVVLLLQATFVPVLLLTGGGPREATITPPLYLYQRAFLYGELGYTAMLSVLLLLVTGVVVGVQALVVRRLYRS